MELKNSCTIEKLGLTFEQWAKRGYMRLVIKEGDRTLIELPYWNTVRVGYRNGRDVYEDAFEYDMARLDWQSHKLQALLELVYSTCADRNGRLAAIDMFQRRHNQEINTEILKFSGIDFTSHNNGVHLILTDELGEKIVDFWPSTELYIWRDSKRRGQGIDRLLEELAAVDI